MTGHGAILGGLSTVPDLAAALRGYRDTLGLELIEQGVLAEDIAASWGCPANAGSPYACLRPASGAPCWFRLVEQPGHPAFKPTRSYGWAAFECTVEDVWQWPDVIEECGFKVVGAPRKLANIEPAFIPMQVLGTGQEMVYLNQVLADMPDTDLPRAQSCVDRIFIVVLAAPDREQSVHWYTKRLGLARASDYTLPYSMINQAFGQPPETLTTITMIQHARMPILEVDDYPVSAATRERHAGHLPPGNAVVTLAIRDLGQCNVDWITPPMRRDGALYEGRLSAATTGSAGELIELVEVG